MQERQVTVEGETFPLPTPVPRARDRQPDRVRRHLPAARGPARPVPAAGQLRLPDRATRSTTSSPAGWTGGRRRSRSTQVTDAAGLLAHAGRGRDGDGRRERRPLLRRPGGGHPRPPRRAHRRVAARLARPGAGRPRAGRCCAGRDYVIPEDVKAVARSVLVAPDHGQARALDDRGQRRAGSSTRCSTRCPTPGDPRAPLDVGR